MDEPELETRASADSPVPGVLDHWGPFEGLQRVGRGSFGEVYRAFDRTRFQAKAALAALEAAAGGASVQ